MPIHLRELFRLLFQRSTRLISMPCARLKRSQIPIIDFAGQGAFRHLLGRSHSLHWPTDTLEH